MTASLFGVGTAVNVNVAGTLIPQSFVATAGQTLFTLSGWTYTQATNSLLVFINGQRQIISRDFTETSSSSFTLLEGCIVGDFVDIIGFPQISLSAVVPGSISLGSNYSLANYLSDSIINVKLYGVKGDGTTDDTVAIQAIINTYVGRTLFFPAGTYKITATISIKAAPVWSIFGPGVHILGDGVGTTFIDSRVIGGPAFDIDSDIHGGSYHANMGTKIEHLQIMTASAQANSTGIRVLNGYQVSLCNLVIRGLTGNGIELKNGLYTDDGWNRVFIDQVYLDTILGWGIKADGSAGRNEGSYTHLKHVFFQSCGTAGAATPPTSGAMIWKGQVLVMENSGAANGCQQVGLFIKGEAGLANTVDIRNWTSENTVGRGLYISGVSNFKGRNIQIYNNDTYKGTIGIEIDGATYVVRQVDIDGVIVRATVGNNPYTAFKVSGANVDNNTVRIKNVAWDNFGYAGQVKFNGAQFDTVPECCSLTVLSTTSTIIRPDPYNPRGNKTPYRKNFTNGGNLLGELVPLEVASAGIGVSNSGLVASTRYYSYLADVSNVPTLELSTTVPVLDTTTGTYIKTGDPSRVYKGSCITDAGILFITSGTGWLNPAAISGRQVGAPLYMWGDSTDRLRVKYAALPTFDTDGTVVGTQV